MQCDYRVNLLKLTFRSLKVIRKFLLLILFSLFLCGSAVTFTGCEEGAMEEAGEEIDDEIDDATDDR